MGPDRGRDTTKDREEKVLAIINEDLGLNHILATDISIAHRVGMRENRPRPIIVKFLSRKHKTQVIQKRRLLKRSGRGLVDDLTPTNRKRLKSVQQHPEVKNLWTKEGMIHALLQNGKIVKITEGNLKIIDKATTGNAPVLDIEMSEVLAPPDNAERRTRLQQQQNRNAGLAASTAKQDSIFRSTHPSVPIRRKTSQTTATIDDYRETDDRRYGHWGPTGTITSGPYYGHRGPTGTITSGPCYGHWEPTGTITSGPCYGHWGPTGTIASGPRYGHWGPTGTIT